jgi:hypothetical protein
MSFGKCGGDFSEWCVGTARDREGAFFRQHAAADLGDGLTYREAYTSYAAAEVVERLVSFGLRPGEAPIGDCPELQTSIGDRRYSVPAPGHIVFVYRPTEARHVDAAAPLHRAAA